MAELDLRKYEDQDLSAAVAGKSAFRVAAAFFAFFLLQKFGDVAVSIPPLLEALFRSLAVFFIVRSVVTAYRKTHPNSTVSDSAFMSTVFFYGMTLAILYAVQIGVIVAELLGNGEMTFLEEVKFVLGIRDFSTGAIVSAFVYSHIPYLAYYLTVRTAR